MDLYCIEVSGSTLACEDCYRALCLPLSCMRLLKHESSSTCLAFSAPALIESYLELKFYIANFANLTSLSALISASASISSAGQ